MSCARTDVDGGRRVEEGDFDGGAFGEEEGEKEARGAGADYYDLRVCVRRGRKEGRREEEGDERAWIVSSNSQFCEVV